MPRVNRDLQRRMAARRDRRRPPTERRYNFAPASTADADGAAADTALLEGSNGVAVAADGSLAAAHPSSKPFSAYTDEYAYVMSDLRRVAIVFGSLLLAIVLLYIILGR